MNSTTSNCEHILNFCRFYYHLQVFKQRNLINYQHRDSGSNRKRATVEFMSFIATIQRNLVKWSYRQPTAELGFSWDPGTVQQLVTGDDDQSNDRPELAEINGISIPGCSWNSYTGSLLPQAPSCVAVWPCLLKCCMRMRCRLQNYLGCHWKYCPLLPVTFSSCK